MLKNAAPVGSLVVVAALVGLVGCGTTHRPTTAEIVWTDDDSYDVPLPEERDPNYTWDFVSRHILHPLKRLVTISRYFRSGDAVNTNALGEVPDSSWFTNRHALNPLTTTELVLGPRRGTGPEPGVWTIVRAKTQGVTPGFNIRDALGEQYIIKFDPPDHPEMATAAEVVSSLFFHAAGYHVTENYIVEFDPRDLVIGEGAKVTDDSGKRRPMNDGDLGIIFSRVARRADGTIRATASKFLSGRPIGPFSYLGRRKDDLNDIYHHADRRELRGLKVMASFLNHADIKGPNTLDMYESDDDGGPVVHYLIDFGATLGSASTHAREPAAGHESHLEFDSIGKSLVTFGLLGKPWDDARTLEHPAVGFFEAETFNPGGWTESYTNAAFLEMTDEDAYWGCKLVMAFTPDDIRAIVAEGRYTDVVVPDYISNVLIARREKIGRYWYRKVAPLDRFHVGPGEGSLALTFSDLGAEAGLWPPAEYHYDFRQYGSDESIGSGVLSGTTTLTVPRELADLAAGHDPEDERRFFSCELRLASEGSVSEPSRALLYYPPKDEGPPRIVRVDRGD